MSTTEHMQQHNGEIIEGTAVEVSHPPYTRRILGAPDPTEAQLEAILHDTD